MISLRLGHVAARNAAHTAYKPSLRYSNGNRNIGNCQPKAFTLITFNRTHASTKPVGIEKITTNKASKTARTSSSFPNCDLVSPNAQTGESCGIRLSAKVSKLIKMAKLATPSVRMFKAEVTRNVLSKTSIENAFSDF